MSNTRKIHKVVVNCENAEFFFLSTPDCIRVNKSTHVIEKQDRKGNWAEAPEIMQTVYPAFYADGRIWVKARVLASLFIPNPNNFVKLRYKDGDPKNIELSNLEWCKCPRSWDTFRNVTNRDTRLEVLEGLTPGTKEYYNAYNQIVGSDGLTNADRHRKKYMAMGYVKLTKKFSPTGRSFFCPPALAAEIREAVRDGSMNDQAVKDGFIQRIKTEVVRHNSWYK